MGVNYFVDNIVLSLGVSRSVIAKLYGTLFKLPSNSLCYRAATLPFLLAAHTTSNLTPPHRHATVPIFTVLLCVVVKIFYSPMSNDVQCFVGFFFFMFLIVQLYSSLEDDLFKALYTLIRLFVFGWLPVTTPCAVSICLYQIRKHVKLFALMEEFVFTVLIVSLKFKVSFLFIKFA